LPHHFDVAVMHDYFVDRLVHTGSLGGLTRSVEAKAAAGGGGLHGIRQSEIRGGNAVNLAHALGRLGLRTLLITHAEAAHEGLLRESFEELDVQLRIKPLKAGMTVAFEERVNVMLGDGGGAADFGPALLDSDDWEGLRSSDVVCSVNWAANAKGTELLVALKKSLGGQKKIFIDPADFRDRLRSFRILLRMIARKELVDWVSMNEEEGKAAAKLLGLKARGHGQVCEGLASALKVSFDLHGLTRSYTSDGSGVIEDKVLRTKPRRLTGAGDVFDAGSIYGRVRGFSGRKRLNFANVAARLYLQSKDPVPPTLDEVFEAVG
jgi:ribokinase